MEREMKPPGIFLAYPSFTSDNPSRMEGARRGELAPSFGCTNVCVKHPQEGTHTPPWAPLSPYLVPQQFSWWRKPVEADFPGAEGTGVGIQWCTQAAFGGLGDLGQASHRGDTIHQLCRQQSLHQCQSSPGMEKKEVCLSQLSCDKYIIYLCYCPT